MNQTHMEAYQAKLERELAAHKLAQVEQLDREIATLQAEDTLIRVFPIDMLVDRP